ncbi:hypothetical protein DB347_01620 [Opitutaceae bacterium EW11]|nr:hypothetical protein DB347_01620 [Opitutaceae bacterium EW11]
MDDALLALPPPVFGVLPEHPAFFESIGYQINGLAVVFIALGLIWAVMETIGIYFKRRDTTQRLAAAPPDAVIPTAESESPPDGQPTPELAAVIAAAVAFTMRGQRYRIEAIAPATYSDWAREGRRQIFASHQVR